MAGCVMPVRLVTVHRPLCLRLQHPYLVNCDFEPMLLQWGPISLNLQLSLSTESPPDGRFSLAVASRVWHLPTEHVWILHASAYLYLECAIRLFHWHIQVQSWRSQKTAPLSDVVLPCCTEVVGGFRILQDFLNMHALCTLHRYIN